MTAALAQFGACADKQANLSAIEQFARQASNSGASMLFLPEYSMFYPKTNRQLLTAQAAEHVLHKKG